MTRARAINNARDRGRSEAEARLGLSVPVARGSLHERAGSVFRSLPYCSREPREAQLYSARNHLVVIRRSPKASDSRVDVVVLMYWSTALSSGVKLTCARACAPSQGTLTASLRHPSTNTITGVNDPHTYLNLFVAWFLRLPFPRVFTSTTSLLRLRLLAPLKLLCNSWPADNIFPASTSR